MSKIDLFKILGTIAVDNAAANKALSETSSKAKGTANDISGAADSGEKSGGKWSEGLKKVGSAAVTVGKTVATGLAVAGGAVAGLVTQSVKAYADYEQLVGGVETLFKDSADTIQAYAKEAYRTAGLSANEYMETVTSFSASLIQSLGGDTAAAAEYAQMAITDMSDNANKMGTDMSMIQNAYQGFAKQNYTMLDNLKLGYGGTQQEMYRLLQDAQKLDSTFDADFSMSSKGQLQADFADIVQAIHIIQNNMGITGTTAKEASATISGSISSMKSSWQNLLVAISADDLPFEDYVKSFADSVSTVADNLIPRIQIALNGVAMLIGQLAPIIVNALPGLVETLIPALIDAARGLLNAVVAALPQLLTALMDSIPALLTAITEIFNVLVAALPSLIELLVMALPTLIPQLVNGLVAMVVTLATMLPEIIMPIINALPGVIMSLADALLTNLPILIQGIVSVISAIIPMIPTILPVLVDVVMQLISMLTEQLPVILPVLIDALVTIITLITEQLPVILPMLIEACITIITAIIDALPTIIMALVDAMPTILQAVWDAIVMFWENLPAWIDQLLNGIKDIFINIWGAIGDLLGIDTTLMQNHIEIVWNGIKDYFGTVLEAIKNVISTAWDSIKNVVSTVIDSVKNVISTAWNAIKTIIANVMNIIFSVIKGDWDSVKASISNILNAIKSVISSVWNAIKSVISSVLTGIKNTVSSYFTGIKNTVSSVWNSIKSVTTNVWNGIKDAMTKPIEKARDAIKGIVDKVKGFFTGVKLEFPNVKLPHFSIKPSGWKIGDLLEGSIPKLGIEWYAKAMRNPMIMNSPTIFGYDAETGRLKGGGESGSEVVTGTGTLMGMIGSAVNSNMSAHTAQVVSVLTAILEALVSGNGEMLAALLAGQTIKINEREFGRTVREYA